MRINQLFVLLVFAFIGTIWAQQKYVSPKENTGIFQNQTQQEKPVIMITPEERLIVLSTKGNFYQVQTSGGLTGWVEKFKVISMKNNKTFKFSDAEVIGYLDNPTPVYILDKDDPNAEKIYLDRSFKDALRDNTDKETVTRQVK